MDRIPLYKQAQSIKTTPSANHGLDFNKWSNWYEEVEPSNKNQPLKKLCKPLEFDKKRFVDHWQKKQVGNRSLLVDYQQRIKKLVEQLHGITFKMKTIDRLVTGIGLPHPLENSLVWHHTLGVPFLPGSSIKGVLRAWLETWKSVDQETIDHGFGKETPGSQAGNCLFFDAIPVDCVKLQADVMTPHFQSYYSGDKKEDEQETKSKKKSEKDTKHFPIERFDPIPIPFLTVAPRQEFLFSIAPRNAASNVDIEQIRSSLEEALHTIGFGAKTAVGYGRLKK